MKRRILLVDDELAILLTLKAILEMNGFEVETASSGREAVQKLDGGVFQMVITDMRMETDASGVEVIKAARTAAYHPAVALLTAFPVAEEDWQEMGADQLLVKPMHTRILLEQIESLIDSHEQKLAKLTARTDAKAIPAKASLKAAKTAAKKTTAKKVAPVKKASAKSSVTKLSPKKAAKRSPVKG